MKQLIFEASLAASVDAGQIIRVFDDGSCEGLPTGTIVLNHFIPLIQMLQGQLIASQQPPVYREDFLALAMECGANLTGKPDGSESITVVFTVEAWRKFDLVMQQKPEGAPT